MTLPAWAASALGSAVATTEVDADPRLCRFRYACNFALIAVADQGQGGMSHGAAWLFVDPEPQSERPKVL
jgi:hypothetical protein